MSKITVKLTQSQIDALLVAAYALMAGEEGEGDFQCAAKVLQRAIDALEGGDCRQQKQMPAILPTSKTMLKST